MGNKSAGELWIEQVLAELFAPPHYSHYKFHPERKWQMDFAWVDQKIYLEYEGKGHSHWNRYHSDVDKYNAAFMRGWRLFRITFKMLDDGTAINHMRSFVALLRATSSPEN